MTSRTGQATLFGLGLTAALLALSLTTVSTFADTPLQGGVAHVEKIDPLFKSLKPGDAFSESSFKLDRPGRWVRIPNWMGGSWTALEALRTFDQNIATGDTDNSLQIVRRQWFETFGLQQDSNQKIWTLEEDPVPVTGSENSLEGINGEAAVKTHLKIYSVSKNKFSVESEDRVLVNSLSTEARVNSETGKVVRVDNHKLERRFTRLADGMMACTVDDKSFDQDGRQTGQSKYAVMFKQTEPFTEQNQKSRLSLRSSFDKFLEQQGALNLKKSN